MGAIIALFVFAIVSYVMRPDWTGMPALRTFITGVQYSRLGTVSLHVPRIFTFTSR